MLTLKQATRLPFGMCQIALVQRSLGSWASDERGAHTHGDAACVHTPASNASATMLAATFHP